VTDEFLNPCICTGHARWDNSEVNARVQEPGIWWRGC
jgi:hypothetical protein